MPNFLKKVVKYQQDKTGIEVLGNPFEKYRQFFDIECCRGIMKDLILEIFRHNAMSRESIQILAKFQICLNYLNF
jgi:hypothetical protein